MRKRPLATLVLLTALSAPQALACTLRADAPPRPTVFWSSLPVQVAPGETILRVEFVRGILLRDPENIDSIVFSSCGPTDNLYRITQVLAGSASQDSMFVMASGFASPEPDGTLIVVGRLVPQTPAVHASGFTLDIDPAISRLEPRLPPQ